MERETESLTRTLICQSAAKNPDSILWNGSTFALTSSLQNTVRSFVFKYSDNTPINVVEIWSVLEEFWSTRQGRAHV